MPLDDQSVQQVTAWVHEVILDDFHKDFAEVYAYAISMAETHPEQSNNEVRNALTHLARALSADSLHAAEAEIRSARGHMERAKRDCLKLCIIEKREHLRSIIMRVEFEYGVLHQDLKARAKSIEKKRQSTFRKEAAGNEDVSSDLEDILADVLDFEEHLTDRYNVSGERIHRFKRFFLRLKHLGTTAITAIVLSLMAGYLFALAVPPETSAKAVTMRIWNAINPTNETPQDPAKLDPPSPVAEASSTPKTNQ